MPEMRRDPLSGDWVIFSPERSQRPANFRSTYVTDENSFDPFLEGNETLTTGEILAARAPESAPNQPGWQARVIPNKYPAVDQGSRGDELLQVSCECDMPDFYQMRSAGGAHDVIVESPERIVEFAELSLEQIRTVFRLYRTRWQQLKEDPNLEYAILFKNERPPAGASLEHVHSQLLGLPVIPEQVQREVQAARLYQEKTGRSCFEDLVQQEKQQEVRLVSASEQFAVFCPFASRFAYETWFVPSSGSSHFSEITESEIDELTQLVKMHLNRLKEILGEFSFNYIVQSSPFKGRWDGCFTWSLRVFPRISQLAGFELGTGMNINAVLPEIAAQQLKEVRMSGEDWFS